LFDSFIHGVQEDQQPDRSEKGNDSGAEVFAACLSFCHTFLMAAHEIRTPFATPERSGDVLGVSKSRVSRLVRWAREASPSAASVKDKQVRTHAKSSSRKAAKKAS
jgi:hypothetical protein